MWRPNRLIRLLAGLSIVAGMLVFTVPAAVASPSPGGEEALWDGETIPPLFGGFESDVANEAFLCFVSDETGELVLPGGPFCDGAQEVYFASVGNGDDFGLGAAQTSVTIQNIDVADAYIFFYVGNGDGWDVTEYAYLAAGASKTFTADDLGVPEGSVVPVAVAAYHVLVTLGEGVCEYVEEGDYWDCGSYGEYPGEYWDEDAQILGVPAFIAGVSKQAVTGDLLPMTTADDTSVSGYNAVSGREVGYFDQLYFPIVQTNCGPGGCWDSVLRVANVGLDANAAVTVRFFPSDDGSGSLNPGFQLQELVNVGETWSIWLSDWVPEGWVGSAHVFSDDAVTAIVDRFKAGTSMWITNTASNAASESDWQFPAGPDNMPYVLFAPDVRLDYNGWNTGINVANTVDDENNVNVQFFGNNGNAPQALTQRLEEHGMTYFYEPSDPSEDDCNQPVDQPPTCDFVGAAIVLSEYPVAVAVDGVKYYGNDLNVGHAFSYAATGNVFTDQALPLAQKGNPATGMGATSGINFLNPNSEATFLETTWINPSGFEGDNFGPVIVWVPGYATGFVYTMFQHNLPQGFTGSALVVSELPIAATSANVDYQVNGDGTVIYNLFNPCGFFRQAGECVYEAPVEPPVVINPGLIIKTVTCPDCAEDAQTVVGATINVTGVTDEGDDYFVSADTNATGTAIFSVPPGVYDVEIVDVPDGYSIDPANAIDADIDVDQNETVNLDNEVLEAGATKIIDVADIPGLLVCVYEQQYDQGGKPLPIEDTDCYRPFVELPKDFVPGQGEIYDRLREPTYEYLGEIAPWDVECDDFEYTEDARLYLDDYIDENYGEEWFEDDYPTGIDSNIDGEVDCDELYPIPYVRPATDEEVVELLGLAGFGVTDEEGDVTFNLPAGCYYAVITGSGYESVIEEFCLEPGETEVNEVEIGVAPGYLYKFFVPPFCHVEGDFDDVAGALQEEDLDINCDRVPDEYDNISEFTGLEWSNVAMVVAIGEGTCGDEVEGLVNPLLDGNFGGAMGDSILEECNSLVFYGGADDLLIGGITGLPFLYMALAPGDYTLCWFATWEYETDDVDFPIDQIWSGVLCEEFTIESEEETLLVNYADDLLRGTLDVYVEGEVDETLVGLDNILVLLFDQEDNLLAEECTDDDGWASFELVREDTFTVTATDSDYQTNFNFCGNNDFYETQDATKIYNVFGDYEQDGFVADEDAFVAGYDPIPDLIIHLDPAGAP